MSKKDLWETFQGVMLTGPSVKEFPFNWKITGHYRQISSVVCLVALIPKIRVTVDDHSNVQQLVKILSGGGINRVTIDCP